MKLILIDQTTKAEIKIGDRVKDFRGDEQVVTGFTPPRHSGSTGRVQVAGGAEYFPGVINAVIVEVE